MSSFSLVPLFSFVSEKPFLYISALSLSFVFLSLALQLVDLFVVFPRCVFLFALFPYTRFVVVVFFVIFADIFSSETSDTNCRGCVIIDAELICCLFMKPRSSELVDEPLLTIPFTQISAVTNHFNGEATPVFLIKVR